MKQQIWKKRGQLFEPNGNLWWSKKYGILPTPYLDVSTGIIRIYFGSTDTESNGRISYIDLSANNPSEILYQHDSPILDIGTQGSFDDCGVVPSSIVLHKEKLLLYYVGFQRCEKVPYMLFPGLAVSDDGIVLSRNSISPIIDRMPEAPYSNAAPFVLHDGNKFKMWHWIGREWITIAGKKYLNASIAYSESKDGISWQLKKTDCIEPDPTKNEFSVGRPWVIVDNKIYKMWYSVRHGEGVYKIAYAESSNGLEWIKLGTPTGLDVSSQGWDSEMMCYPAVVSTGTKTYLFYNGNNNGATGFGYAELVNHD